ncbi:glycosyltransferase [Phyllobacterium ifriqiyense]|uniref:glycosyltransferase n=1 Tax=Phyllobacterium ifriqiyense TaxID=314238 RepID=UPI0033976BE1
MARRKWRSVVSQSNLFDKDWYLQQNPDVAAAGQDPVSHYLIHGWKEMRDPCQEFSGIYYLNRYPDIVSSGYPPLVHFLLHGRQEGRHLNAALDVEWNGTHRENGSPITSSHRDITQDSELAISVVIPTFNRLHLLPRLIDSWRKVAIKTNFRYEIIFSDDGSTDGTIEYLEKVSGLPIRLIKNQHGGASNARNSAIRAAKGHRLLIIGDDIFPDDDLLNVHLDIANRLGENIAVLGVVDWAKDLPVNHLMKHITEIGNEQFSFNRLPADSFVDFRHFYTCNISIDRALVVAQETIFDERFSQYGFEDIELGYRLSLQGLKIFYSPSAKGEHFHPYEVAGFCKRQTSSGRMAVVFRSIHPGISSILQIHKIESLLSSKRNVYTDQVIWEKRLKLLIERCTLVEKLIADSAESVRKVFGEHLSTIYSTLFKSMYEYGVLQGVAGHDQVLAEAMNANFGSSWLAYWQHLEDVPTHQLDLEPKLLSNLIDAHLVHADNVLEQPGSQRPLFQELKLLSAVKKQSLANGKNKISHIRIATYLLFNDPRFLYQRVLSKSGEWIRSVTGRRLDVAHKHGIPAHKTSRLKLILTRNSAYNDAFISYYTAVFGSSDVPIVWIEEGSGLSPLEDADGATYFWPEVPGSLPHKDDLLGAWLALLENSCDIALISYSLLNDANLRFLNLRNQMLFSETLVQSVLSNEWNNVEFSGKIYRTEILFSDEMLNRSLSEIFSRPIEFFAHNSVFHTTYKSLSERPRRIASLVKPERSRPVVFVFPIFVAVGGVERNTIEIIRELRDRYDFVVITMERLRPEQGSLASQFQDAGAQLIQMSEIVSHEGYLTLLLAMKNWLQPSIIWICNGSPWLCDNAENIRRLFSEIPIVDQQVYDVAEGWINRYQEPGIQSFDRFIAVNQRILTRFTEEFEIPRERVDLIYSAVNTQRIKDCKHRASSNSYILEKLGLPTSKKIFTFVGRLTTQKRPLDFLKLAKARQAFCNEFYVLIGDGELMQQCGEFIVNEGLTNVVQIPFVENTIELATITDGLVITSAYEGLPIAMIEVISCGVPVFSTDAGDISNILEKYNGGMTIPIHSSETERMQAFEKWISRLSEFRVSLNNSEVAILDQFSSHKIAEQYVDCFTTANHKYGNFPV